MYANLGLFVLHERMPLHSTTYCLCNFAKRSFTRFTKSLSLESHRLSRSISRLIIKMNYDEDETSCAIYLRIVDRYC